MKMLFELLDSNQKRRPSFKRSDEYSFFMTNKGLLGKIPRFSFLDDKHITDFDIMRANIILHSYLNKVAFEEEMANFEEYIKRGDNIDHIKLIQALREKMVDCPYYKENQNEKDKIFIPFFSRSLNNLYFREPEKLLVPPYNDLKDHFADSIIDPFDVYGAELFNSNFTRLLKIKTVDKVTAYFHYDTFTIYFVNNQGRLDNKIVLFDKYMKRPSTSHMLDRISPVVDAYFAYDRAGLINNLHDQDLISSKILYLIHKRSGNKK